MNGTEDIEARSMRVFTEQAYLDYSMYVILDRALPHIGDGLKPVQRRIIYAMSELGLDARAKHKKSARTVGDVLGKFHPHGDSACYEAMVLMAQPFSFRYPLVDGQGNWGAPDNPKSFAAMRYTEARLTAYADVLLGELGQGTADWGDNFDGSLQEPLVLPARLPNVLLNGTTGIAVGMATDIPPHNLREIAAACVRLLEKPKSSVVELMEHIKGPDFPTPCEIVSSTAELREIYQTGGGSVRMRARWEKEGPNIIVTALPFQSSGAKIQEQIAAQMLAKKLPMLEDLRDESDHETPTRLVLAPRSNRVDAEQLMSHLFATTDLERNCRVNLNVIGSDGLPAVKDLRALLSEWLAFRTTTVTRRLEHRLDQVNDRLHLLEGYLIAFLNIDEVIAIIRHEDEPKAALMARFELTATQAEAILNLRLRNLARLEEQRIRGEQKELTDERKKIEQILKSARRMKTLIRDEILADAETYGDARRSPIVSRAPAQAMSERELAPSEPITVVLSAKGWVRAAKGHEIDPRELSFRSGDTYQSAARGRTNQTAVFADDGGRCYAVAAHTLPSARGQGEPLAGSLSPPDGAHFVGALIGEPEERVILSSDHGYGFIATLGDLVSKNRAGKAVLSVSRGARAIAPARVATDADYVAATTTRGYLLVFPLAELPAMARGKGLKIIQVPPVRLKDGDEHVNGVVAFAAERGIKVHAGSRFVTLKGHDLLEDYQGERARRGAKLPRGYQKVMQLEAL